MNHLLNITTQLLDVLEEGRVRFLDGDKPDGNRAYFQMVKQTADPIFDLLEEWEKEAFKQIAAKSISLHPQQITATIDNMEMFILHSFYKDTRKRKFIEIYKSCYYIFSQCIKEQDNE